MEGLELYLRKKIDDLNKMGVFDLATETLKSWLEDYKPVSSTTGSNYQFIITYTNDGFEKEMYWVTTAKSDVDAVDEFWKTHDVLSEIISVKQN